MHINTNLAMAICGTAFYVVAVDSAPFDWRLHSAVIMSCVLLCVLCTLANRSTAALATICTMPWWTVVGSSYLAASGKRLAKLYV